MGAPVATLLARKGTAVVTIVPDATLSEAAGELTRRGIGALVVSDDDQTVLGIISERDIVRAVATAGTDALQVAVSSVMVREVITCTRATTSESLMATMTDQRVRHVPVLEDGRLAGIVSIGDVVKQRIDELLDETSHLEAYVTGTY